MSDYEAGGGKKLGVVRYGRDLMETHERIATGSNILPGMAVMKTTDGNGDPAFTPHDGSASTELYVAVEARGRGMDAQDDTGYVADSDYVKAVRPAGGGLNLLVTAGENISDGDPLEVDTANAGQFVAAPGDGRGSCRASGLLSSKPRVGRLRGGH